MPLPSMRDHEDLRSRLGAWLAGRLPAGSASKISALSVPEGNGMSSETLLFDAEWTEDGAPRVERYVVRMSPDMNDFPVFPAYDLQLQFDCLRFVRSHSGVPAPFAPWLELDPAHLGSAFMVMERIDGIVPPDLPPYPLGSWLSEATPKQRARLQRDSLAVLADLHSIDIEKASDPDARFLDRARYGGDPLDQHVAYQREFYDWAREGVDYPVIERTFAWLDARRPTGNLRTVLNWGDARIGNILYRDFEAVAVLDWEMAALGPPEIDLAWMLGMHDFFAEMADAAGFPPMEGFFERDELIATYESLSGHRVRDFEWFYVFAGLRYMIISIRIAMRSVAYGQQEPPAEPDEAIMNRAMIQRIIDA